MVVLTDVLNTVAYQDNVNINKTTIHLPKFRNKMDVSNILKDYPVKEIRTPHANDVLSGRGGGTNNHPGNEKFRELVHSKKVLYVNSSKREKALVSCAIVDFIRNQSPPGRFLQRDEKSGLWYDIGDQKAREKTSQALREGAPDIRREISMGAAANALSIAASVAAGVHEHQPRPGANGGARSNVDKFKVGGRAPGVSPGRGVDATGPDDFPLQRGSLASLSSIVGSGRVPSSSMLSSQDGAMDENMARAMLLSRNDVRRAANGHSAADHYDDPNFPFSYSVMDMLQRKAAAMNSFNADGGGMIHPRHNPFASSMAASDQRRRLSDSASIRAQQSMFNSFSFGNGPSASDAFLQQYGPRSACPMPAERAPSAAAAAAMMMGMHNTQPRQAAARIQQAKAAAANAIAAVGKVLAENNMELLRDPSKANRVLNNRTPQHTPPLSEQRQDPIKPTMDFIPPSSQVNMNKNSKSTTQKQSRESSPLLSSVQTSPTTSKKNGDSVTDHFKQRLFLSEIIAKTTVRGKVDSTMSKKERAATMYQFAGLIGIKLEDLTDRLSNGSNTLEDLIQKAILEKESRVDVSRCSLTVTEPNLNGKRSYDSEYEHMHTSKRMKSDMSLAMKKRITSAFTGINAF